MTTFQWLQISLQATATAAVVVGLTFTVRQLRLLTATYRDLHDWNRRKAAQDAVGEYRDMTEDVKLINDRFKSWEKFDPISWETLEAAFKTEPQLTISAKRILNYFEGLANGVRQGVFDEAVIKSTFRTGMRQTLAQLYRYVEHRRTHGSPRAWLELERILDDWDTADHGPPRSKTGASV